MHLSKIHEISFAKLLKDLKNIIEVFTNAKDPHPPLCVQRCITV